MTYRAVDTETWDDPWFAELQPISKLLFLYLFTNRRVTQCGAMEITVRQIAFETGISVSALPNEIDKLGDRVRWWPDHSLLIVRNFYKRQRAMTGDKFEIAARKSAAKLPDFAREWVYGVYPELRERGDTHPIPTPVPIHNHAISVQNSTETGQNRTEAPPSVPPRGETAARGSRIPDDFAVDDEMRRWATGKGFTGPEIDHHTEAFLLHWRTKAGANARKVDWRQTWQGWLHRETPGKWPGAAPKPSTNGRHPPLPHVLQPGHVPPDGGLADYKRLYGGGSTAREAS